MPWKAAPVPVDETSTKTDDPTPSQEQHAQHNWDTMPPARKKTLQHIQTEAQTLYNNTKKTQNPTK